MLLDPPDRLHLPNSATPPHLLRRSAAMPWRDFAIWQRNPSTTTPSSKFPAHILHILVQKTTNTAKMTRAQQTISIAMILTSV